MRVTIIDVTPAMAAKWLQQNTQNRPISVDRVEKYARDMAAGEWALNGEAVKRALDGTLLDGQQRLTALVKADVTVPMVVVEDLLPEVQDTMDQGRARTVADSLGIHGIKNAPVVASVGRRAWQWDQGNYKFSSQTSPTPAEIRAYIKAHETVHRSAEMAAQVRSSFRVAKQSVVGTAHHVLLGISPDDAALFFAQMTNGAGLEQGHPVLTLRNRFLTDKITGKRNPFHQDVALIFRAWNGVREGRSMARILHTAEEGMIQPL